MNLSEKMETTDKLAVELMKLLLTKVKLTSSEDYNEIAKRFEDAREKGLTEQFKLVQFLIGFERPYFQQMDRFSLLFQALRIYASLCDETKAHQILDALVEANALIKNQNTEGAVDLLRDVSNQYV